MKGFSKDLVLVRTAQAIRSKKIVIRSNGSRYPFEKKMSSPRLTQAQNGSLHLHGGFHVINLNARVYFVTLSRHLTESYTFLSGKPERNSSTSMRNNTYLLTLRANCATICQMRKDTTPTRPQLISSDYFVFLQESLAKVLTSRSAPFSKARFQNKN